MAQTIVVTLAVDDQGSAKVQQFAQHLEGDVTRAAHAAEASVAAFGKSHDSVFAGLAAQVKQYASLAAAIALPAGLAGAVSMAAAFEKQMSGVSAVAGETGDRLRMLALEARKIGPQFGYSATQAAESMQELALAGFDTNQILELLPNTMVLARAGALDLKQAAGIASDTLRGFGLQAKDFQMVVDQLAYAASYSNAEVSDLGEAFTYVGSVASSLGVRFDEVNAGLAVLANQGIRGERAGSGMNRVLAVLVGKLEEGEKGIASLGIKMRDSHGNFVGLAEAIKRVNEATKGMSEFDRVNLILEAFGQRGGPTMLKLMQAGSAAISDFDKRLQGAAGSAKQMAETRLDNLSGDWDKFLNTIKEIALTLYESAGPGLRELVQGATHAAEALAALAANKAAIAALTYALEAGAAALAIWAGNKVIGTASSWLASIKAETIALYEQGAARAESEAQLSAWGLSVNGATAALDNEAKVTASVTMATQGAAGAERQYALAVAETTAAVNAQTLAETELAAARTASRGPGGMFLSGAGQASLPLGKSYGMGSLGERLSTPLPGPAAPTGQLGFDFGTTSIVANNAAAMASWEAANKEAVAFAAQAARAEQAAMSSTTALMNMGRAGGAAGGALAPLRGLVGNVGSALGGFASQAAGAASAASTAFSSMSLLGQITVGVGIAMIAAQLTQLITTSKWFEDLVQHLSGNAVDAKQQAIDAANQIDVLMRRLQQSGGDLAAQKWFNPRELSEIREMADDLRTAAAAGSGAAEIAFGKIQGRLEKIKDATNGLRTQTQDWIALVKQAQDEAKKKGGDKGLLPILEKYKDIENIPYRMELVTAAVEKHNAALKKQQDALKVLTEQERKRWEEAVKAEARAAESKGNFSRESMPGVLDAWAYKLKAAGASGIDPASFGLNHKDELLKLAEGLNRVGINVGQLQGGWLNLGKAIRSALDEQGLDDYQKRVKEVTEAFKNAKVLPVDEIEAAQSKLQGFWDIAKGPTQNASAGDFAKVYKTQILELGEAAERAGTTLSPFFQQLYLHLKSLEHSDEGLKLAADGMDELNSQMKKIHGDMARYGLQTTGALADSWKSMRQEMKLATSAGYGMLDYVIANRDAVADLVTQYQMMGEDLPAELSAMYDQLFAADRFAAWFDSMKALQQFTRDVWTDIANGIGESFARAVVYGESFTDSMKALGKQILATFIKTLVAMAVNWAMTHIAMALVAKKTTSAVISQELAGGLALVAVNSMASVAAIPVWGWAAAPGVGAANLAFASALAGTAGGIGAGLMGSWNQMEQNGGGSGAAVSTGDFGGMSGGSSISGDTAFSAQGGLVLRPTRLNHQVGENFHPEAIVPLSGPHAEKARRSLGLDQQRAAAQPVVVNITINGDNWNRDGLSRDLVSAVHSGLSDAIASGYVLPLPKGA